MYIPKSKVVVWVVAIVVLIFAGRVLALTSVPNLPEEPDEGSSQQSHYRVGSQTESEINDDVDGSGSKECRIVGNSSPAPSGLISDRSSLFVPTFFRAGFDSEWLKFITAGDRDQIPDTLLNACGVSCDPDMGLPCVSDPNVCGERNTSPGGEIQCDGSCNLPPPEPPGAVVCETPNSCNMNDGVTGWTDICQSIGSCNDTSIPSDDLCDDDTGGPQPCSTLPDACGNSYEGIEECQGEIVCIDGRGTWPSCEIGSTCSGPYVCTATGDVMTIPVPEAGQTCGDGTNSCGNETTYDECGNCVGLYNPECPEPGCGQIGNCGQTCGIWTSPECATCTKIWSCGGDNDSEPICGPDYCTGDCDPADEPSCPGE